MTRYYSFLAMAAILVVPVLYGAAVRGETPTAGDGKPALVLEARPYKSTLVVGEPLVLGVTLSNRGEKPVYTAYAQSGVFRRVSSVSIKVRQDGKEVLSASLPHNLPHVIQLGPKHIYTSPEDFLQPGEAVRTKCTFALITGMGESWLGQGTYTLNVSVRLQGFPSPITAEPSTLTVVPATAATQEALAKLWRPDSNLPILIEGEWGKPTEAMTKMAAALKEQYPSVPYGMYMDFYMLWGIEDFAVAKQAAETYLNTYPDSPYCDDILWGLAQTAKKAQQKDLMLTYLDRLIKQYPDSPYEEEAKALLAKYLDAKALSEQRKAPDPVRK